MENSFQNAKLSEVVIDRTQFDLPETAIVNNAKKCYVYDQGQKTSMISHLRLECVDKELAELLQSKSIALSNLSPFSVELYPENSMILETINENMLINRTLKLGTADLMLRWDSARRSWGGLKLVMDFNMEDFT